VCVCVCVCVSTCVLFFEAFLRLVTRQLIVMLTEFVLKVVGVLKCVTYVLESF